jgi:uncharacterized protein (DUF1684 family)
MVTNDFETDVMKWREERAERLRTSEKSWLGLAGLFWLKEGNNTFGSDPGCNFVLPPTAPKKAGVFNFKNDLVTVKAEPNVKITCNDGELPRRLLRDDQQDKPDFLSLANLIMVVIKRGKSTLIRLWDIDHPLRKAFSGLNFFPYKPEYRIIAKYNGYAPFKVVKQEDIIGEVHDTKMIGAVVFDWEGKQYQLDAEDGGEGLFITFRDKTNADSTYAGGRSLLTEQPKNGQVVLDFNKAYNMPCAYTLYATCGLPTVDNRLTIPIEAGEKKYQDHH